MSDSGTVLGIPVPGCARVLAGTTPAYPSHQGDELAPGLLIAFGKKFNKPRHEIKYESQLSYGLSDIVILLERPYVEDYHVNFETIVQKSPTLRAVDELIRFSSCGARSIFTVTVLNTFPMQPDKKDKSLDEACHRLVGQVLQSFHPSCAVNNTDCRPEYRALLIHHFLAAFRALLGHHTDLPEYVEPIRQLCLQSGQRRTKPRLYSWQAAEHIEEAICRGYIGPNDGRGGHRMEIQNKPRMEKLQGRAKVVCRMYSKLEALAQGKFNPGALALAKIMTFFWKDHFTPEPIFQQVLFLLQTQGNRQSGWFASRPPESETDTLASVVDNFTALKLNEALGHVSDGSATDGKQRFNAVIGATKSYLTQSSVMELITTFRIASSLRYCETMADLPAGENLEFVLRSSQFWQLEELHGSVST
ncbi:elicitin domain-containing protein [Pochonia chlamydosporia 170]|uniref:Elicitin domain-containing protein n=1 Tax=Pochonia chlamydosporia 170 TaxID=1380566 RepID=A0A179EZ31_METCM|nr:elicitin domain-containing protein [Pochonia chlamydosporia 170]OAQ58454.1 elicitin domain-containing protein [Pochonia chlamydosporia 170]